MKFKVGNENPNAVEKLADDFVDNSGVGVHYMDAYLDTFNNEVMEGHEVKVKRRGLKVSLKIDGVVGSGLMRRLDVSSDPKVMLQAAIKEAAENAGHSYILENGSFYLEKQN